MLEKKEQPKQRLEEKQASKICYVVYVEFECTDYAADSAVCVMMKHP